MKTWDFQYYKNEFSINSDSIDDNKIRQWFPLDHVKEQTMEIYQELLGLKITKMELEHAAWHPEVTYYEVQDEESNKVIGHFYMDLHPRPDKYNHAAVFTLVKRAMIDGKLRTPTVAMVTNFRSATAKKPSLLSHGETKTFFHEFGHIMHNTCSEANFSRFAGMNVERDFVEMPSQMLENWILDKDILKRVSKHYITGEPLSDK